MILLGTYEKMWEEVEIYILLGRQQTNQSQNSHLILQIDPRISKSFCVIHIHHKLYPAMAAIIYVLPSHTSMAFSTSLLKASSIYINIEQYEYEHDCYIIHRLVINGIYEKVCEHQNPQ